MTYLLMKCQFCGRIFFWVLQGKYPIVFLAEFRYKGHMNRWLLWTFKTQLINF